MAYELNNKLSKLKPYDPIEGEYKIRLDANESYINLNDSLSDIISTEITKLDLICFDYLVIDQLRTKQKT